MTVAGSAEVVVIGGGGHAKVVISTLQALGFSDIAVYDDNSALWGGTHFGVPVRGGIDAVPDRPGVRGVIAIGNNRIRRAVSERFRHVEWVSLVHPAAHVERTARLGRGTVVFAGAVIQPDVMVGDHVIINTGATVDHDGIVEDFAHVAVGCHLAGGIRVGMGAFLGTGSAVIPGCTVGPWATVGAGGVVIRDVPAQATVAGVPAKVIRGS